jgi:hypothetical protein
VQQVDHRPEVAAFLDVDLEQVAQVVHARTALAEQPLLLDARRFRVALSDNQAAQLVAELAGNFVPHRLTEEITEADPAVVHRIGEKDAPAIFRQLHVLEMRPPLRIDADRRAHVDLVVILEALRSHVPPPLDVLRLPVLERPLQPLVAGEVDVVRDFLGGDHSVASLSRTQRTTENAEEGSPASRRRRLVRSVGSSFVSSVTLCVLCAGSARFYVRFQSNSGRPCSP